MPAIETIPVPSYQPLDPYNSVVDNLPIIGLSEQMVLVNNQVDNNTTDINSAIGTQGTLANRLAQSLNPDGSIKTVAIDNALHDISAHLDGNGFVRMTLDERNKLSFIAPNATSLSVHISTVSGTIPFVNSTLELTGSDSIVWGFDGVRIFPDMNLPASVRHAHYYGLIPVTTDYKNYKTTSINTAYRSGSLRVYINGIRLNPNGNVYVPFGVPYVTWTAMSYTEGTETDGVVTGGDFSLSSAISSSVSIVVDFDVSF